jgi:hypothetical protein
MIGTELAFLEAEDFDGLLPADHSCSGGIGGGRNDHIP